MRSIDANQGDPQFAAYFADPLQTRRNLMARSYIAGIAVACVLVATSLSAQAQESFDLAAYRLMKADDPARLAFVLGTMRETVFYAQESIGKPVLCASPRAIPTLTLIEMIDKEIAAPSNPLHPRYENNDHMAFVFVAALKRAAACK